jgi:hypothetical protein
VSFPRRILDVGLLSLIGFGPVAALLASPLLSGGREPGSQDPRPQEHLHGVLSRARLSPPLRGTPQQVQFSPDGKHLLVQLESGIYILNRRPLETRTWIYATDVLPARFSADSGALILATRNLAVTRWNLAGNRKEDERILKKGDGLCLASELSPHGDLAACLDPSLALQLYRTDTAEQIFGQEVFTDQEKLDAGLVSAPVLCGEQLSNRRNQLSHAVGFFKYGVDTDSRPQCFAKSFTVHRKYNYGHLGHRRL